MKRRVCYLCTCILVCVLSMACGEKNGGKSSKDSKDTDTKTTMQVGFTDKQLGEEYKEYEGEWESKKDKDAKLYVYRVTEQYVWFTYSSSSTDALFMRAEKEDDGKYYFYYGTKASGHCYPLRKDQNGVVGTLSLHDGMIEDKTDYVEWNSKNKTQYEFIRENDKEKTMDVFDFLDDYHKAYAYYEINKLNPRFIGMDKASTKEECDNAWGAPYKIRRSKKGYCCVYRYKDYQIRIYFSEAGAIYDMTLFLKSREKALTTYRVGDFEMRGSQIVKYVSDDVGTKEITFPQNAVAIERQAFDRSSAYLEMCIPKDLDINIGAFSRIQRAKITFEEGRTEIPRSSFANLFYYDITVKEIPDVKITLPKSIHVIRKNGFKNYDAIDMGNEKNYERVKVTLNEGLEEIEDGGVYGLYVNLPKSLKKIGNSAICWPVYAGVGRKELILPPNLEEIANNGIIFEEEGDCEGEYSGPPEVAIPKSVKKIGKDPVVGGKYVMGK